MECIMLIGGFLLAIGLVIVSLKEDKQIAEEEDEWQESTR